MIWFVVFDRRPRSALVFAEPAIVWESERHAGDSRGTDWHAIAAAFGRLPWLLSVKNLALASIWTGNNSFTGFSSVSALLPGYIAAASPWIWDGFQRRNLAKQAFLLSVASRYMAQHWCTRRRSVFWFRKCAAISSSPWYTQPILKVMTVLFRLLEWYRHWTSMTETLSLSAMGDPCLILQLAAT